MDDIGPGLLESITKGLYTNPFHVIREYVQNEVDARPPPKIIKVRIDGRNISIWGDGSGMNRDDIGLAKRIGFSTKNSEEFVGFRGIGIWSGLAVAENVIISTKRHGEYKKHLVSINAAAIRKEIESRTKKNLGQLLSQYITIQDVDAPEFEHGTHVQLFNVIDEISELLQPDGVKAYMAQVLPVALAQEFPYKERVENSLKKNVPRYREFLIDVNGSPIYRPPFYDELEAPHMGFIKGPGGNPLAYYWVSIHKHNRRIPKIESRSLVYKSKNFTVGDREICKQFFEKSRHLMDWCAGEVHIVSNNIRPNAERIDFENGEEKKLLVTEGQKSFSDIEDEVRKKSHLDNIEQRLNEADSIPKSKFVFRKNVDKLEAIVKVGKLRDYLLRVESHRWTPIDQKSRISVAVKSLSRLYENLEKAPIDPKAASWSPTPTVALKQESGLQSSSDAPGEEGVEEVSLSDLAISLHLPATSKKIIDLVEDVLDRYFDVDSDIRIEIKQQLSDKLTEHLRTK